LTPDRDGDGFMLLGEWLTPQGCSSGGGDRGPGSTWSPAPIRSRSTLSRAEFLAYTQLEVDPIAVARGSRRSRHQGHGLPRERMPTGSCHLARLPSCWGLLAQGYY
jgi:hypothetical protein